MKKILKMIEDASNHEEKIIEALVKKLKTNKYLKECLKKLNNYDYDHLTSNNDQGVDWQVYFDVKKLNLDGVPQDFIKTALEMYFDGDHTYMNLKEGYLYQSSADEIWVSTHSNSVHLSDKESTKYYDDFHLWLLIEDKMETSGYFPGIYTQDYHGNVDEKKFDEDYKQFFAEDDSKKKQKQIDDYLELYKNKQWVEQNTAYIGNLFSEKIIDSLPSELKAMEESDPVSVLSIEEITPEKLTFKIELGSDRELSEGTAKLLDAKYGIYEVEVKLIANALHFILTDDKTSGGTYGFNLSLLPV